MSEQGKQVIDEVLSRIDIVDLISEKVVLKRSGSNYLGLCPFHTEKSPSFSVSAEKQIFRCFGCGIGGNIFEFYKNLHNISFGEALKDLAKRAGVILVNDYKPTPEQTKKEELKETIYEIYKKTMAFYKWNLEHKSYGEIARNYLLERKVAPEMIEKFSIGYSQNSWDSLYLYLQKRGFHPDEIKESGLVIPRNDGGYYDRFRNRVMFPIQNDKGDVIAFGGRTLETGQAKYINSPETPIYIKGQHLYGLNFAKNKIRELDKVILVEGYLDVITCHEYGFENAVASLGTALTPEQAKKLLRFCKKVLVAYDSDNAGKMAAERGTEVLEDVAKGTGININVIQVPSGKDPDEFLHVEGAEKFQQVIDTALPIIEFQVEQTLLNGDFSNAEGKTQTLEKCLHIINKIKEPLYRDEVIKKIANWRSQDKKLDIREEDIRRKIKIIEYSHNKKFSQQNFRQQKQSNYYNNYKYKNFKKNENEIDFSEHKKAFAQKLLAEFERVPGALKAEKGIIYYLVERHRAIDYIRNKIEHIEFIDPVNEKIKNTIYLLKEEDKKPEWKMLLNILTESAEQERIVEIWESFESINISDDIILKDFIRTVKLNCIKIQRDELRMDIDEAGIRGDHEMAKQLMGIYGDLQKDIKLLEMELFSRGVLS